MSTPDLDKFAEEVLSDFASSITDEVFLSIQTCPERMRGYLRMVETHGLDRTNQTIGKAIKARFNLTNAVDRCEEPRSTLIRSHQLFK